MPRWISLPVVSLVCLAVLVAAPAAPSAPATHLFLPAVGTGPGVPPSYWYTTIWVYNPQDLPVEVELSFLRRNQANDPSEMTHTIQVDAGEVVQIDNAVTTLFGVQGFGAIRAVATEAVHITARIYSKEAGLDERDSTGQAFVAVPEHESIGVGEAAELIGLTNLEGGDYRYNVGFVETTGHALWVEVALFATGGSSWVSRAFELRPFEQMQMSVDQLFNNAIGESDNFRLRATGWSGGGRFIVFGSRIANGSQDATTFEMMVPPAP
jgi:hypothetical protein